MRLRCIYLFLLFFQPEVYAACGFINGATTQTFYVTREDDEINLLTLSASGLSTTISVSALAERFGVTADTRIISCNGNENLLVGGSSLSMGDSSWFQTNVPNYRVRNIVNGIVHPNAGADNALIVKQGLNGDLSLYNLFTAGVQVNQRVMTSSFTSGIVEPYKALTISTTDGLEIMHIYVNAQNVRRATGCKVASGFTDVDVDLGETGFATLAATGTVANKTPFTIGMYCFDTVVNITFEGNTDSLIPSVFTNASGDGYAENVGVQIAKDGVVISPNIPFFLDSRSISDWALTVIRYDFSAQIFSLAGETIPGVIDIPVVFTLSYD